MSVKPLLLGMLLWVCVGGAAWGKTSCLALFRAQSYAKAAACFESQARAPQGLKALPRKQQVILGRRLRNAAIAYRMAAAKEKKPSVSTYYREHAIQLLQRYLDGKLYEHLRRKNNALALQRLLQKKIKYALLTVVTGDKKARLQLRGFRFDKSSQGQWTGKLRPGRYRLSLRYPKARAPITRSIELQPGESKVLTLRPPAAPRLRARVRAARVRVVPPRRPQAPAPKPIGLRVAGGIALGVGALAAAAGGLVYGLGQNAESSKRSLALKREYTAENRSSLTAYHDQAAVMMPSGIAILGVGGAALLGGGLMLYLSFR